MANTRSQRAPHLHATMNLALAMLFALVGVLVADSHLTLADDPLRMVDGIGTAQFITEGGVTPFRTSKTIPYWSSSFSYNGVTYPYTMVGTNPMLGPASTTVNTVVVPLSFAFDASASPANVLDGGSKVNLTLQSPIFQNAPFSSGATFIGNTQYGDAIQKAMFWQTGGSASGYHVLLNNTQVFPTQSITVPKNQGFLLVTSHGSRVGLMSYSWFSAHLHQIINQLHIPSTVTPIFLTDNVFLYVHDTANCCVLGYHGAFSSLNGNGDQQVQTFIYSAYIGPNLFGSPYLTDIHALSHEVSEWMADPFVNNIVPPWQTPTAPQYGCTNYLETGDPVVGIGFTVPLNGTIYHPEDEVYLSWFARESPSRAANGWYTFLNTFHDVAHGCS